MLSLAEGFMPAHIQSALRRAQPLTEVSTYRYPGGVWRRYDHMTRYPKGLLVIGDALCCLDPINGQGMAMATLHAHTLRTQLRHANLVDPQAFYTAIAAVTKPIWAANAAQPSDHTVETTMTSLRQRAIRWSRRKVLEAAVNDIVVTERLMRVANLIDPPQRLLDPALLARVVVHHTRQSLSRHHEN